MMRELLYRGFVPAGLRKGATDTQRRRYLARVYFSMACTYAQQVLSARAISALQEENRRLAAENEALHAVVNEAASSSLLTFSSN